MASEGFVAGLVGTGEDDAASSCGGGFGETAPEDNFWGALWLPLLIASLAVTTAYCFLLGAR